MKTNRTGFKGVSRVGKRYQARIRYAGKTKVIGYFTTAEEASDAYQLAAAEKAGAAVGLPDQDRIEGKALETGPKKLSEFSINWSALKVPERVEELLAAAVAGSILTLLVVA